MAVAVLAGCSESEIAEPGGGDARVQSEPDLASLRSHPYAGTLQVAEKDLSLSGVVTYEVGRAFPGLNLYTPREKPVAYLMRMDGSSAHRWAAPAGDRRGSWQHVELTAELDLLVIEKDLRLIRYDWDSKPLWAAEGRFHHDLDVAPNGDIYALSRTEEVIELAGRRLPALIDEVVILSAGGEEKSRISFLDIFGPELSATRLDEIETWAAENEIISKLEANKNGINIKFSTPGDLFHVNSIEILDRTVPGFCKKGDFLVSLRTLDMVAVIDPKGTRIRWSWGPGEIEVQHHPTLLSNGNVLLFDNGWFRGHSRVVELDPLSLEIVWEYKAPDAFLTRTRGGNQRLPNGNTLIVESDAGRAFEVDSDGRTVWEFYAPVRPKRKKGKERSTMYRVERLIQSETPALWRRLDEVARTGAP